MNLLFVWSKKGKIDLSVWDMDTWVRPVLFEMVLRTMGLELFVAFLANFRRKRSEVVRTNFAKYGLVAGSTKL